jgi:hypothetical protein
MIVTWPRIVCTAQWLVLCGVAFSLVSCGAHSPNVLQDQYDTIHISVFKNETLEFALEERLTRDMILAFERDGRLKVFPKSRADLEMSVRIKKVDLNPIAFSDLDRAIGYNMTVFTEVDVLANDSDEYIIQNKAFQAQGNYLLNASPMDTRTQSVSESLAEQVVSFLIEGW